MTPLQQTTQKLKDLGAELFDSMNNGDDDNAPTINIDLYDVHGKGLILCSYPQDNEPYSVGLYTLVGKNGDPIEDDLAFIEQFAKANKEAAI